MIAPAGWLAVECAALRGVVAQLGERRVRNAKVGSSILLHSTRLLKRNGPLARPVCFFAEAIYLPAPVPDEDALPVPLLVLEPVPVPTPPPSEPLVPVPVLVPAPLVPTPTPLEVPPAPLTFPCSRRHWSLSRPVSVAQRGFDPLAPVAADPLVLPPMPVLLLPTPLPVLVPALPVVPPALLPVVPLPMLPLGLDDVCAMAPMAKRAAAVALTNSFKLMKCSCN